MTHAYQEMYLSNAQALLGDAFDYAINACGISENDFVKLFSVSSVSKRIENGEPTYLAEIELVLATTTLLGKLDFHNFTIRINDRKILKAMAQYSGFPTESFDTVFIILDKMDKIGLEGVAEELAKEGFAQESIDTYLGMFKEITSDIEGVRYCKEKLKDVLDPKVADDLETIISAVDTVKSADFKISFDPTLVRGMSYYTGPIFEIAMDEFADQ